MGRRKASRRDIWRVGGSTVYVIIGNDMLLTKPSGDSSECVRSLEGGCVCGGVALTDILLWFKTVSTWHSKKINIDACHSVTKVCIYCQRSNLIEFS